MKKKKKIEKKITASVRMRESQAFRGAKITYMGLYVDF